MNPSLAELLQDPRRVVDIPVEAVPALLGDLERLKAILWARMMSPNNGGRQAEDDPDELLTVRQAARRLGLSVDALYRKRWPFEVRPTSGTRRFSAKGIERYIRQRQGR